MRARSSYRTGFAIALFLLALVGCERAGDGALPGYVESDVLMMAPLDGGRLAALAVDEGDQVEAGALLFRIDAARLSFSAEQAREAASAAEARAAAEGALAKAVAEAEAQFENARISYERARALYRDQVIAKARLDSDRALFDAALARLERARAEQDAALKDSSAATAGAGLARQRVSDTQVHAPAAGVIERVYRRPGEVVGAGEPVLALLPPENVKIRFYAPEPALSSLAMGGDITFTCDGCSDVLRAQISFIAREPQFTPPVIYSLEERGKLVFLVEARPEETTGLRPGLPVRVRLP